MSFADALRVLPQATGLRRLVPHASCYDTGKVVEMETVYRILTADGSETQGRVDWPETPGYDRIKDLIEPLIDGDPLEHVAVLHEGERRDMFVSEVGHMREPPLPRNEKATAIYRNAWMGWHPTDDPEHSPWIAGTAVLFDRIVWA